MFETNVSLGRQLIQACNVSGNHPHIIFASSVHQGTDTAYGSSKQMTAEALREWERESGGFLLTWVLPNIFGEHGRPFYNSVIATFCYQLAQGQEPEIIEDREIELIHIS